MRKILFTFILLALSFSTLSAQTAVQTPALPAAYTKAPDYRPDNELQYLNAMAAMEKLDAGQLTALAEQLKPYGSRENTPLQYALNGYAGYVMKPGRETLRHTAVQAYGQALHKTADKMNKQFLIRQLQLIGKTDAVPFLTPFLTDAFLSHSAAQALATIASPEAKKALRDALQEATSATRTPLIEALGDCRDKEAVELITPFVKRNDPALKKVALYALATIGAPASAKVLLKAAKKADFVYEPSNATADCMLFMHRLIADGQRKAAREFVSSLQKKSGCQRQSGGISGCCALCTAIKGYTGGNTPQHLVRSGEKGGVYTVVQWEKP